MNLPRTSEPGATPSCLIITEMVAASPPTCRMTTHAAQPRRMLPEFSSGQDIALVNPNPRSPPDSKHSEKPCPLLWTLIPAQRFCLVGDTENIFPPPRVVSQK